MEKGLRVRNGTSAGDSGAISLIVLLVAILAIAAFAFFAWNGNFFLRRGEVQGERGTDINIEGTIDLPESGQGTQTPTY